MAEEAAAAAPPPVHTNGTANGGDSDEEDPSKLRPVNIEQDMREMERRKRVEAIMNSKLFREELERVVNDSLTDSAADGLPSLLTDMMKLKGAGGAIGVSASVIPINDIRGLEGMGYTKTEKQLRCKLAAAYRLVDLFGWSQGIYNHITQRISQDTEHFLLNPFGMLYSEVTASSLVKVDMQGSVVESGTTNFGVSVAGFTLHSAIHANRPDLKAIIHVHYPSVVAVSACKQGLLPLSQEACILGNISYHAYSGILIDPTEKESIARDLGVHNKVMILRNHGAVCCGETIEEAFFYAYHLVLACDTQLKMAPLGMDNLTLIDEDTRRKVWETAQRGAGGVNSATEGGADGQGDKKKRHWGVGEMEFEALMRWLDNAGYRTGYVYRNPLVKEEPPKPKSDVELPPAVSSLGYLLEEENLYKDGPLRALLSGYVRQQATKGAGRTKWMNSPNVYQKVEILETGTPDPKKITKWVADGSPSKSTPIKVESPNQFVPLGTNKKEFKKIQAAMKEGRRAGGITAGPESKVLDGATWEERADSVAKSFGDNVDYKVGAASKGIIQRDYQHHATVYKSVYAKNPFDNVSSDELEEYKRIVDMKSRGEDPYSPGPGGDYSRGDETTGGAAGSSSGRGGLSPVMSPTTDTEHDGARDDAIAVQAEASPAIAESHKQTKFNTLPKAAVAAIKGRRKLSGANGTYNGEETDGNRTFSEGEGEGDTSRATDPDSALSPKKEKKKSGLRTPSFLKKKKKEKKDKSSKKEKA